MKIIWLTLRQAFDLLDIVLLLAFVLLTSGAYQLWGLGWACMMLGGLLLTLVFVGVPTGKKS